MKYARLMFVAVLVGAVALLYTSAPGKEVTTEQVTQTNVLIGDLPVPVKDALTKEMGANKLLRLEQVAVGETKTYRAIYSAPAGPVRVEYAADGTVVVRKVPMTLDRVPTAVREEINKEAGNNKVLGIVEVQAGEARTYTARFMAGANLTVLEIASDGKLLTREMVTTLEKVPTAARDAINKELGASKLHFVSQMTRGDLTYYHVEFFAEGKLTQLDVNADGTITARKQIVMPAPPEPRVEPGTYRYERERGLHITRHFIINW